MCNKPNRLRQNTRPEIHGILSPNPQSNASQEAHKRAYKSAIRQQCDAHRGQAKRGGDGRGGTHANPTRHPVNHRFTRPVHKEGSIPYGEASLVHTQDRAHRPRCIWCGQNAVYCASCCLFCTAGAPGLLCGPGEHHHRSHGHLCSAAVATGSRQ